MAAAEMEPKVPVETCVSVTDCTSSETARKDTPPLRSTRPCGGWMLTMTWTFVPGGRVRKMA